MDLMALTQACAAPVHPATMTAIAKVESDFNQYAIGVVGGRLERQPGNKAEAVATAEALEKAGYNFSLGVGQINRYNLAKYGLNYESAFEPCANLRAGASILKRCFDRARRDWKDDQFALRASFSCYYSGNFVTGFRREADGGVSYVQRVLQSAGVTPSPATLSAVTPTVRSVQRSRSDAPIRLRAEDGAATLESSVYQDRGRAGMVFR